MIQPKYSITAASVAYGECFNRPGYNNQYSIIAMLIKAVLVTRKQRGINSTRLTHLLKTAYGFRNITESIVRITVRTVLKDCVKLYPNGYYRFEPSIANDVTMRATTYESDKTLLRDLSSDLLLFVGAKEGSSPTPKQKSQILGKFYQYLLDGDTARPYGPYIEEFIKTGWIPKSLNKKIPRARALFVLYEGLRFTPAPAEFALLKTPLRIFLAIEQLFNCLEFNGPVFKSLFDDLYHHAEKINRLNRKKLNPHRISFHYLDDTREEFHKFFDNAVAILEGEKPPLDPDDPSRQAMETLLDNCYSREDIEEKRVSFEQRLQELGITLYQFTTAKKEYQEFSLHDTAAAREAKARLASQFPGIAEGFCFQKLKQFSEINWLRQGNLFQQPEDALALLVTNQKQILHLANSTKIQFMGIYCPFALDIDFLTNTFWFHLKMGFANDNEPVPDFDVIARTYAALEQFISDNLALKYELRLKELESNSLSQDTLLRRVIAFRDKAHCDAAGKPILPYYIPEPSGSCRNPEDHIREKEKLYELIKTAHRRNRCMENKIAMMEMQLLEIQVRDRQKRQKKAEADHQWASLVWVTEKWQEFTRSNARDAWYYLTVITLTYALSAVTNLVRFYAHPGDWIYRLSWPQFLLVNIFIYTSAFETFGKSYVFKKERVLNGRRWLLAHLPIWGKNRYMRIKAEATEKFEADFLTEHKPPSLQDNQKDHTVTPGMTDMKNNL